MLNNVKHSRVAIAWRAYPPCSNPSLTWERSVRFFLTARKATVETGTERSDFLYIIQEVKETCGYQHHALK